MRRFKGFTLTELMIALAVIGILVAVVTPAIMRTRPNKNKMMIKKTYYETEKIVESLINDETLYIDGREACNGQNASDAIGECRWGFDDFKKVKYDGEEYGAGDLADDATDHEKAAASADAAKKFAGLFAAKLNCRTEDNTNLIYTTADGVIWYLSGTKDKWSHSTTSSPASIDSTSGGSIVIDVNGGDGPNCRQNKTNYAGTACTGSVSDFDQYKINISVTGKMTIDSADSKAAEFVTINTSLRDAL